MKSCYILLVAAAALLSSASGISLTQDGGTSTVVKRSLHTFDGVQVNGDSGRFLRSYTERDDSEDPADEERGFNNKEIDSLVTRLATNTEELPAALESKDLIRMHSKLIADQKVMYKEFAKEGTTPESLYEKLKIQHKLDTLTDKQLEADGDFFFYLFYRKYWNKRHGKNILAWLNKLLGKSKD